VAYTRFLPGQTPIWDLPNSISGKAHDKIRILRLGSGLRGGHSSELPASRHRVHIGKEESSGRGGAKDELNKGEMVVRGACPFDGCSGALP
jgi:hypothetical protein